MSYEFEEGYKIRDQAASHFLTFTIMGWIDIFSRQRYRDIILDSFKFCREKKALKIGAYVIMYIPSGPQVRLISATWSAISKHLPVKPLQLP
jgi:hypothetical protein